MKLALVGAECEENLALRYIRAALDERGHRVTQITFNAETDTEMAVECLARSGAGLAEFSMSKATQSHPKATSMRQQSHLKAC